MSTATPPQSRSADSGRSLPEMKVTRYDVASSALVASVAGLLLLVIVLIAIWLANLLPTIVTTPIIMEAGDGGWEDGDPNETLNVESPEDPSLDPSLATDLSDVTELMEINEQVVELAENATQLVEPNEFSDASDSGNPGSAVGTGGRPYGRGGPGTGGEKRDQRWFVTFDKSNLQTYARQLDFFGIELGAVYREEKKIVYLSNLSQSSPTIREVPGGKGEERLFMNWDGNSSKKKADIDLFAKAKITDADRAMIVHFYPTETEQMLARIEQEYQGRSSDEIRRTAFRVTAAGNGFEFKVTSQKLK